MLRVSNIAGKSLPVCDFDRVQSVLALIQGNVYCGEWDDFNYSGGQILCGIGLIPYTRPSNAPLSKSVEGLAVVYLDEPVNVPNNPNSKSWIELEPTLINDPLAICDGNVTYSSGENIGRVNRGASYPTDRPYMPLWDFDATGTPIDKRECFKVREDAVDLTNITNLINTSITNLQNQINDHETRIDNLELQVPVPCNIVAGETIAPGQAIISGLLVNMPAVGNTGPTSAVAGNYMSQGMTSPANAVKLISINNPVTGVPLLGVNREVRVGSTSGPIIGSGYFNSLSIPATLNVNADITGGSLLFLVMTGSGGANLQVDIRTSPQYPFFDRFLNATGPFGTPIAFSNRQFQEYDTRAFLGEADNNQKQCVIGVANTGGNAGDTITYTPIGYTNVASITGSPIEGSVIYLGDTPGQLTTIPGSFCIPVGTRNCGKLLVSNYQNMKCKCENGYGIAKSISTQLTFDGVGSTIAIAHGLGRKPKFITARGAPISGIEYGTPVINGSKNLISGEQVGTYIVNNLVTTYTQSPSGSFIVDIDNNNRRRQISLDADVNNLYITDTYNSPSGRTSFTDLHLLFDLYT